MKPKIKKQYGSWVCVCDMGIIGEGDIPIIAFLDWQLKRKKQR